jgi:hypothetical protein
LKISKSLQYWLSNPAQLLPRLGLLISLRKFNWMNRLKRSQVIHPDGPVVTLTTYGRRLHTVHLTLESIGRGSLLPSRLILWLDEKQAFENLPPSIRRLQGRGLEVKPSENYGPYKKYYPYVLSLNQFDTPMVTADDDVLYPPDWLKNLDAASKAFPDVINCYRARRVSVNGTSMAAYNSFELLSTSLPSICHMSTGVSGVIYPPAFQKILKNAGPHFAGCCPRNDDIWLYLWAVRSGYRVRQISSESADFPEIPGTQGAALYLENVAQGGNDRQISATFTDDDVAIVREALARYPA